MKPHKHAELIKAWADGAEIEVKSKLCGWTVIDNPTWGCGEYRIKPQPKPWHEKIPPQGVLCWVWFHDYEKRVQLVTRHDPSRAHPYITNTHYCWEKAIPLTQEETLNLIWQDDEKIPC